MRSGGSVHGQEKELTEFFDIKEEKAKKSDMVFFMEGTQEREETFLSL